MSDRGLQAALFVPPAPAVVAGLPAVVRTAHRLASEDGGSSVLLVGAPDGFCRKWESVLKGLPVRCVSQEQLRREIDPDSPLLCVASGGMPLGDGLRRFREEAERRRVPAAWIWRGRAVCVYTPEARPLVDRASPAFPTLLDTALEDPGVSRVEAADAAWVALGGANEVAAAEERLYAGLSHGRDGYISQFDRRISIALSRRLALTAVTPNQITAASIAVGLAGAALVTSPGYATCLLGTLLAWLSSILDGCDGEIARLKLLFSEAGKRFDLAGDHIVNFSLIGAIAWHVHRERPDLALGPLALLLATGVAMSGLMAWWLFLRQPQRRPAGVERALQRLASRDFIYLVIPLAALRRLDWFVYGAAFGSHVFWIALVAISAKLRFTADRTPPATP
jgi:phosphatidylglycerophosphate synthase